MPAASLFRTWLQLVRVPNLLTVPGDPLAGYLLGCFGFVEENLWLAIGASLCFYAGGLLLNDLADLAEDRRERPSRPLPSGAASPWAVGVVLAGLFALALGLCARIDRITLATGGALLLAIVAYNCGGKRIPILGPINMGLCRGLSLLLGATAVPHGDLTYRLIGRGRLDHLVIAACVLTAYVAAVTHLARFETRTDLSRVAKWLPFLTLVVGAAIFLRQLNPISRSGSQLLFLIEAASALLFVIAATTAFQTAFHLTYDPAIPVPPQIGKLIRGLLLIQAAFCVAAGSFVAIGSLAAIFSAGLLVAMWPMSRALSRRFYAS